MTQTSNKVFYPWVHFQNILWGSNFDVYCHFQVESCYLVCSCYYLYFFYFLFCFFLFLVSFCLSPYMFFFIIITFFNVFNTHVYFNYIMIQIEPKKYTVPNKHMILNCFPNWYWPYSGLGGGTKKFSYKFFLVTSASV